MIKKLPSTGFFSGFVVVVVVPSHFVWTNHCMNKGDFLAHCQALNNEIDLKEYFLLKDDGICNSNRKACPEE